MTRRIREMFPGFLPGSALAVALAAMLAIAVSPAASAQDTMLDATPPPEDATSIAIQMPDEDGVEDVIGSATFDEQDGTVSISVFVENLEPGDHGIHIHEIGICDPDADPRYSTAGGHYNPTDASHGPGPASDATPVDGATESHAGDLGNITVGEDGTGTLEVTTDRFTLDADGENTLADENGSALVIHANADDLQTDPSGESGDRIACAVIFAGLDATPVPVASPATGG